MTQEHHFCVEEANEMGIEKAILIYNIRFWLEKNKVNKKNIFKYKDGKSYFWTYNSSRAFLELFPYMTERSISRYLKEMEKDGILLVSNHNKIKYDKTKWYSLPEYVYSISQIGESVGQIDESISDNGEPIPDNNTNINTDNKPSCDASVAGNKINPLIEKFKPINPSYERLYSNKTQRSALERMVKKWGVEKVGAMIDQLPQIITQKGAPRPTTPYQLEEKLGAIKAFLDQNKQKSNLIIL